MGRMLRALPNSTRLAGLAVSSPPFSRKESLLAGRIASRLIVDSRRRAGAESEEQDGLIATCPGAGGSIGSGEAYW